MPAISNRHPASAPAFFTTWRESSASTYGLPSTVSPSFATNHVIWMRSQELPATTRLCYFSGEGLFLR